MRIIIAAHWKTAGHCGKKATEGKVHIVFTWDDLAQDVKQLTQRCIQCIIFRSRKRILRRMASALHEQKPDEVDYSTHLYM